MRSHLGIVAAAVCLLHSAVALAEDSTPTPSLAAPPAGPVASVAGGDPSSNSLREGVWSLAFNLPTGGSPWLNNAIGGWYMLTPRVNLGLYLNLTIDPEYDGGTGGTFVNTAFAVAPSLKYYFTTSGPVTPYFVGQLAVGFNRSNNGDTTANTGGETAASLDLVGGFGLEMFPYRFLSFGGHVGLDLGLLRPGITQRTTALATFTSAIYATVYFQ